MRARSSSHVLRIKGEDSLRGALGFGGRRSPPWRAIESKLKATLRVSFKLDGVGLTFNRFRVGVSPPGRSSRTKLSRTFSRTPRPILATNCGRLNSEALPAFFHDQTHAMQFFSGYTLDDYNRLLTIGRWALGVLAICLLAAIVFTQWISSQIVSLHEKEREELRRNLLDSQAVLRQMNNQHLAVGDAMNRLTVPRKLTDLQTTTLKKSLQSGPRGKVVVTFLTVEWDAEQFARQIAQVLVSAGFEVTVSEHLWTHLDHDGLYLCQRDSEEVPEKSLGAHIQQSFAAARLDFNPTVKSAKIWDMVKPPEGAVVIVVSDRK
jgi:hypothetical protein